MKTTRAAARPGNLAMASPSPTLREGEVCGVRILKGQA